MRIFSILIIFISLAVRAGTNSDFEYLPFLDQNIKFGLGMSYSKLEANSDVGNYYLLSQANPRFEVSYSTPIVNLYRHRFSGAFVQELFRPENPSLIIKSNDARSSLYLAWEPTWLTESKTLSRHFKFAVKNSTVISEIPNVFSVYGDVADRYSLEGGVGFTWYGLTVSKFPLGCDLEVLYSQTLFDGAELSVYNGLVYRFGIDFELKKRSLFSGWGLRAYYEYEDLKNGYSHFVDKEIGVILNRAFAF